MGFFFINSFIILVINHQILCDDIIVKMLTIKGLHLIHTCPAKLMPRMRLLSENLSSLKATVAMPYRFNACTIEVFLLSCVFVQRSSRLFQVTNFIWF